MQIESQRCNWRTGSCQLHLRNRAFCTVVVRASRWLWGTAPEQFSLTWKPQGMGEVSHPWSQTWAGGIPLSTGPSRVTQSRATSPGSGRCSCAALCYGEFSFLFQSSRTSDSLLLTCARKWPFSTFILPHWDPSYPTQEWNNSTPAGVYMVAGRIMSARYRATYSANANYPNFIYSSGVLGVFYQIRMWTLALIMCREKTHHFKLHYETSATLAWAWKISEFPFNDLEDYVQQERRSGKSVINITEYF